MECCYQDKSGGENEISQPGFLSLFGGDSLFLSLEDLFSIWWLFGPLGDIWGSILFRTFFSPNPVFVTHHGHSGRNEMDWNLEPILLNLALFSQGPGVTVKIGLLG